MLIGFSLDLLAPYHGSPAGAKVEAVGDAGGSAACEIFS